MTNRRERLLSKRRGPNDAVNEARQLAKDWRNRRTLDNPRLVERYIKAEIVFHVHLRCKVGCPDPVNLCAILQATHPPAHREGTQLEGPNGHRYTMQIAEGPDTVEISLAKM